MASSAKLPLSLQILCRYSRLQGAEFNRLINLRKIIIMLSWHNFIQVESMHTCIHGAACCARCVHTQQLIIYATFSSRLLIAVTVSCSNSCLCWNVECGFRNGIWKTTKHNTNQSHTILDFSLNEHSSENCYGNEFFVYWCMAKVLC